MHFINVYHRERAKLERYVANSVNHITAKENKTKCGGLLQHIMATSYYSLDKLLIISDALQPIYRVHNIYLISISDLVSDQAAKKSLLNTERE